MKNLNQILIIGLAIAFMVGCGQSSMEERSAEKAPIYEMAAADSMVMNMSGNSMAANSTDVNKQLPASSSAAVVSKDTSRKFIRTADLKFKVKNVRTSTYRIEDIAVHFGGFVTYTHLASNIDHRLVIPVSADSSLECTYYTVINNMTIRVPNTELDTTLKSMAYLIDYLDYRLIKADDITLSMLANKMSQKRLGEHEVRLKDAIDNRGRKLNETSFAEDKVLDTQTKADNSKLSNLGLQDQIEYSTITLNIYQRQSVKREMIENDRNIESYKPGFFHQVKEAIQSGWMVFESIFLFLVQMWGVILIGIGIFIVVRKFLLKK